MRTRQHVVNQLYRDAAQYLSIHENDVAHYARQIGAQLAKRTRLNVLCVSPHRNNTWGVSWLKNAAWYWMPSTWEDLCDNRTVVAAEMRRITEGK